MAVGKKTETDKPQTPVDQHAGQLTSLSLQILDILVTSFNHIWKKSVAQMLLLKWKQYDQRHFTVGIIIFFFFFQIILVL